MCPSTTTCAPRSDCGFSSTGFMSVEGFTPQARACSACARPISPPSAATAALFDMFCGLNGRTRSPRPLKARATPATMRDLPTPEAGPANINARAAIFHSSMPRGPVTPAAKRCLTRAVPVARSERRREIVAAIGADDELAITFDHAVALATLDILHRLQRRHGGRGLFHVGGGCRCGAGALAAKKPDGRSQAQGS